MERRIEEKDDLAIACLTIKVDMCCSITMEHHITCFFINRDVIPFSINWYIIYQYQEGCVFEDDIDDIDDKLFFLLFFNLILFFLT